MNYVKSFVLTIDGKPAGMHRPRTRVVQVPGGKSRATIYTDPDDKHALNNINSLWVELGSPAINAVAVGMSIAAEHRRPASHYGTGRNAGTLKTSAPAYCAVKPDLDNLAKLVMDGLNGRAYRDDVDVVILRVQRAWSPDDFERTIIRVWDATTAP